MVPRPLLIFDLDGALFGLDAMHVCESVWLPELAPIKEAPFWVVGLFSLRGQIVPVADLHLRFGHPARPYSTKDQLVVLEAGHGPMGLIVSEVIGVVELSASAVQPPLQFDDDANVQDRLAAGEARVGDELVTLLDVSRLTRLSEAAATAAQPPAPTDHFRTEATPAERALFHARAVALRQAAVDDQGMRIGLAVVGLGGEYFGVELAAVQEFCNIGRLAPIPCCPPHILGAMNLRGDLVTLIDPRAALNLPATGRGDKAVIARIKGQAMGIAVDAVLDVAYLKQEELQPPPAALRERNGPELIGTAAYAGETMTVLDLPALLAREDWIVNQHV